jgi:hypothetical protein
VCVSEVYHLSPELRNQSVQREKFTVRNFLHARAFTKSSLPGQRLLTVTVTVTVMTTSSVLRGDMSRTHQSAEHLAGWHTLRPTGASVVEVCSHGSGECNAPQKQCCEMQTQVSHVRMSTFHWNFCFILASAVSIEWETHAVQILIFSR